MNKQNPDSSSSEQGSNNFNKTFRTGMSKYNNAKVLISKSPV